MLSIKLGNQKYPNKITTWVLKFYSPDTKSARNRSSDCVRTSDAKQPNVKVQARTVEKRIQEYDWPCMCGNSFSVGHALSCPRGGFPSSRHNEIRDLTARLLTEVCRDVRIEPGLQPIPVISPLVGASANSFEGARLDVAVNGFWAGRYESTFIDVRVFNPHADSSKTSSISATY